MPNFFISYRRSDQEALYLAHTLFRELRFRFGENSAFLDVVTRSPGLSFPMKVDRALSRADVVLVIIGPAWLKTLDERLADPSDWVRYEVAQSLKRDGLPVVPICTPGVELPRAHELPDDLKDLAWRDGLTLDPIQDFDLRVNQFLNDLERVLEDLRDDKEHRHSLHARLATLLSLRREGALKPLLDLLILRVHRLSRGLR